MQIKREGGCFEVASFVPSTLDGVAVVGDGRGRGPVE